MNNYKFENFTGTAGSGKMAKVAPTPRIVAEQQNAENAVDIGSVVASRISSIRKLQEDQFNVEARLELEVFI